MILASVIGEVPVCLIVCISVYLIGMWVTLFFHGLIKYDDERIMTFITALLWPLFLCCAAIVIFGDWCEQVSQRKKTDTARRCLVCVKKFLDFATLPLRPFSFGMKVSDWRSRKDGCNVQ